MHATVPKGCATVSALLLGGWVVRLRDPTSATPAEEGTTPHHTTPHHSTPTPTDAVLTPLLHDYSAHVRLLLSSLLHLFCTSAPMVPARLALRPARGSSRQDRSTDGPMSIDLSDPFALRSRRLKSCLCRGRVEIREVRRPQSCCTRTRRCMCVSYPGSRINHTPAPGVRARTRWQVDALAS